MRDRDHWNAARYDGSDRGHYESYFQRANHPTEAKAFWIRYTIFQPKGRRAGGLGELWAMYFDGTEDRIVAVRQVDPLSTCRFDRARLGVRVRDSVLTQKGLSGGASHAEHRVEWDLEYTSPEAPLLLFPEPLYDKPFPRAKALVGSPLAVYSGSLVVDGERVPVDGWLGSQNHNWGSKHTDAYAWGQVAGFDGAPDVFLELSTARIKIGPLWTPRFTPVVLRVGAERYELHSLTQALSNDGHYDYFSWRFDARQAGVRIHGTIGASAAAFVGLTYLNPPGGSKTCLNSKIAHCEVTLERPGEAPQSFQTQNRAAFEILTDDPDHGVPVLV